MAEISQVEQPEKQGGISRRDFVRASTLMGLSGFAAWVLAACGVRPKPATPEPQPVPHPPPGEVPTPPQASERFIPGVYSQEVIDAGLRPREFTDQDSGEARVQAAIDYLDRWRTTLRQHPDDPLINPAVQDYHIHELFPISLLPDKKTTLLDLLDIFFQWELGQNELGKQAKTKVIFNSQRPVTAETATPHFSWNSQDQRWERDQSVISFGNEIVKKGNFLEENGQPYPYITDLDIALISTYEMTHPWREDKILIRLANKGQLPPPPSSDMEAETYSRQISRLVDQTNADLQKAYSLEFYLPEGYQPNIAQGNSIQVLFLRSLETLNQGYMPGARLFDPTERALELMQPLPGQPSVINLYRAAGYFLAIGDARTPGWLELAGR